MSVVAIIPARMASSRFPGKPLAEIIGLSMIEHVRRRVMRSTLMDDVVVATCDEEIAAEVKRFGGKVVMTDPTHESCVDRVAEAAEKLKADIIINVQGDMPFVQPESLDQLIQPLLNDRNLQYTDMIGRIIDMADFTSPNVVKVVVDKFNNALYYSREPIPSVQKVDKNAPMPVYKQYGINAYRKESLLQFTAWPRTYLEKTESIDMLRILEMGVKVRTVCCDQPTIGVDTIDDLKNAVGMMKNDSLFAQYKG